MVRNADAKRIANESLALLVVPPFPTVEIVVVDLPVVLSCGPLLEGEGGDEGGAVTTSSGQWSQLYCCLKPLACEVGKLQSKRTIMIIAKSTIYMMMYQ